MACPTVITGDRFLERTLTHIDCQAQSIGSWGYQSLAEPGSIGSIVMASLLTIFVALLGFRLMFGGSSGARDIVFDVAKVGIVLTLAFSWPAYKVLVYDLVLAAPADIAASIGESASEADAGMISRLQQADNSIVNLTEIGTGRNTGAFVDETSPGATFEATAMRDDNAFGWSRLVWLAGTIGVLALLRLAAGLMLAIAPIAAALMLFDATRGLFAGWLRSLVLVLVGSIGSLVVLTGELAILEPWLADALRLRELGYATPSAPIELFAITLAFALVQFGMLWLIGKFAFNRGWITVPDLAQLRPSPSSADIATSTQNSTQEYATNRVQRISDSIERRIESERQGGTHRTSIRSLSDASPNRAANDSVHGISASQRLGQSQRRTIHRRGAAQTRREVMR